MLIYLMTLTSKTKNNYNELVIKFSLIINKNKSYLLFFYAKILLALFLAFNLF